MKRASIFKAFILTLILVVAIIGGWEFYLRSKNINTGYDDGKELWADKRARVYQDKDKATVFIGASRNKHDLDIETWKRLTGNDAVQLAIEGNSPLPVLDDLANDKDFKGKLVIDVTEGLVFSLSNFSLEEPREHIAYYKNRTPAQKASFAINHVLESKLVFLDKFNFSIAGLLTQVRLRNRPGVFTMPYEFPTNSVCVNFERQNIFTNYFENDTTLQRHVKDIWIFFSKYDDAPITGKPLDSVLATIKTDTDKIIARGGQVVFVRTPCSGEELANETKSYPRNDYWERLLKTTGCPGIHFQDYPPTDHFVCPENSHLKQSDAVIFTTTLVDVLKKEKGWQFTTPSSTK